MIGDNDENSLHGCLNSDALREEIANEILSELKCETLLKATLVKAICITAIIENGRQNIPQTVCRFYLPDGQFIGEVSAKNIITQSEERKYYENHLENI